MIRFAALARRAALVACAVPVLAAAQDLPDPKTLMDKHNAALGGRAALDKYSSMRMVATMNMAAMGMEASVEMFRGKPNRYVQKIVLGPVGEILQGYDGKVAWALNPMAGAQLLEGDALESARTNADFFANFQDFSAYTDAKTVELTDFEGRKCYKVTLKRRGLEGAEYFDAATGLLAGISGSVSTAQGTVMTTTVFEEYGEFGGLRLPKRMAQRTPQGDAVITISAIEFDKVDPAVFELPAAVKALVKP